MTADDWLRKLADLNVYRAKGGPAPHKPLLLLVVLNLAEEGGLPDERLELTPELAFRFCTYWSIVARRRTQRPDVRLPFHHLQSDGFWESLTEDGGPSPDLKLTRYARLNPEFMALARDPAFREQARRVLIATYFRPEEHIALFETVGPPVPPDDEIAAAANLKKADRARGKGREAKFRLVVVAAYNYTCALTGYRLTTITAGSMVDAAHIHQFADSRNNDPDNGLALSKNAHWLFDNGLWTLDDDFRILVASGCFSEASPDQKALGEYQGQEIRLPRDRNFWPRPAYLRWHRQKRFQGGPASH